ncbi:HNH endonuclease family protein [Pseudonocardia adelaidensis]|uniref:HNH endonuclease family protein n=1 Tax=Pseudonocardia adelaidensis TaxID=648754 RepID=A0ABP9NGI5_9PSEU
MRLPVLVLAVVLLLSGCGAALGDTVAAWPAQVPPYDRDAFGDGWADADRDCQDTRQEILIRDLVDVALTADGCDVATGTLNDLYTGTTIAFQRGQGTSDDVQIDHVIPLSYAWQAGAWQWSDADREAFANDGAELRAVDGPTNNSKGDRGPSRWLPPNPAAHCTYAASWHDVASAYALVLDGPDAARIEDILSGC